MHSVMSGSAVQRCAMYIVQDVTYLYDSFCWLSVLPARVPFCTLPGRFFPFFREWTSLRLTYQITELAEK